MGSVSLQGFVPIKQSTKEEVNHRRMAAAKRHSGSGDHHHRLPPPPPPPTRPYDNFFAPQGHKAPLITFRPPHALALLHT